MQYTWEKNTAGETDANRTLSKPNKKWLYNIKVNVHETVH